MLVSGVAAATCGGRTVEDGAATTEGQETGDAATSSGCGETTAMTGEVACPDECSLSAAVCGLGLAGFVDCGTVDLGDDAAAWEAVHDCALAAVSERQTFVAVTANFTFDSTSYQAHVGQAGCPYVLTILTFDDDPCGGLACGPAVWEQTCAGLSLNSNCIGVPGEVCLRCDGPGDTVTVCGEDA